jgi:hypothetical protein
MDVTTDAKLAAWNEERDAVRQRAEAAGAQPGVSRPGQLQGLSGLQIMQAILASHAVGKLCAHGSTPCLVIDVLG